MKLERAPLTMWSLHQLLCHFVAGFLARKRMKVCDRRPRRLSCGVLSKQTQLAEGWWDYRRAPRCQLLSQNNTDLPTNAAGLREYLQSKTPFRFFE